MIYLDNAATAMPFEAALKRYNAVSLLTFGNTSSNHAIGRKAAHLLEESREQILSITKLDKTHNLLFTSGATEANNLAIKGIAFKYANRGKRLITSAYEHPSVLNVFYELRDKFGYEVVVLNPREDGTIHPEDLEDAMDDKTILVSIMCINNEIATINNLAKLKAVISKYPKCFFHTDVTQGFGKAPLDLKHADLISFSGHKFGSVKGVGGLFVRKNIQLSPLHNGGGQEEGIRPGTVNVAGIASMAEALTISYKLIPEFTKKCEAWYNDLYSFFKELDGVQLNSLPLGETQTPYIINIGLVKKKASVVVESLSNQDIYVSSVSACSTKTHPSSYVLESMGYGEHIAANSIRISFGHQTTSEDIETFKKAFKKALEGVFAR